MLAAGASTRYGGVKQHELLPAVLAALAGLPYEIVVVEGAYELEPLDTARLVHCDDWARGPGASLRCGLAALSPQTQRAAIVLADGPDLDARALERVLTHAAPVSAATYDGRTRNHPVALDRSVWDLVPDEGARAFEPALVDCTDLRPPGDVDVRDASPVV